MVSFPFMTAGKAARTTLQIMPSHSLAIVFPGQGSQRPRMGCDFAGRFRSARLVFEEASAALGLDMGELCAAEDGRLGLTEYAQPAILTAEIAMLRACQAELGLRGDCFGGHSLGEYTALVAAGVLPLGEAVRVVRARGRLMQEAVPVGRGRMVAVIGEALDPEVLRQAIDGLEVTIANDNSSSQVVLSGLDADTRVAEERIAATGGGSGVRFVELDVSAPFHSPLMASIEPAFAGVLDGVCERIDAARAVVVTSNFTGDFHGGDRATLIDALVRQISGTVRWRRNMETLARACAQIFEIGPGRPLRGFFKTIGIDVSAITDLRSAEKLFASREVA